MAGIFSGVRGMVSGQSVKIVLKKHKKIKKLINVLYCNISHCQSANYYYKYLFYWLNFYLVSKYKFAMQKSALTVANIQIQHSYPKMEINYAW